MKKKNSLSGFRYLSSDELELYNYIISSLAKISSVFNFKELKTSTVDLDCIFNKLGESTDIVNKEIYRVNHTHSDESSLILRPEFTCQVINYSRNFLKNTPMPMKFFSYGSVFRHNRAQKGRYREFHQFNLECIDQCDSFNNNDLDNVYFLINIIKLLELSEYVVIEINNIGSKADQDQYSSYLQSYFKRYEDRLSDIDKLRLQTSPLRILDSALESDIESGLESIENYLSDASENNIIKVQSLIKSKGINCSVNKKLVRGLDYYRDIVFEVKLKPFFSIDSTIIAGGRYHLNDISGVGFAVGIDRLMIVLSEVLKLQNIDPQARLKHNASILVSYDSDHISENVFAFTNELRSKAIIKSTSISVQMASKPSNIIKSVKKAEKFDFLVFFNETSLVENKLIIKNMLNGDQFEKNLEESYEYLIC